MAKPDYDAALTYGLAADTLTQAARELDRLIDRCTDKSTRVRLLTFQHQVQEKARVWTDRSIQQAEKALAGGTDA